MKSAVVATPVTSGASWFASWFDSVHSVPPPRHAPAVRPPRLPDPRSPVGAWAEETFLRRFRAGEVFPGSPMPWGAFARFTDDDLRAIYRYLRSLPATPNQTGAAVQAK